MQAYTVGYGGRTPQEFLDLLEANDVNALADVRLRPDRASMETYANAKDPDANVLG